MNNERGNILLTTTIWMSLLITVIGSCLNLVEYQLELAKTKKNTSQNYHLAQSAIEEQVRIMNQALVEALPNIIQKVSKYYISQLALGNYSAFEYSSDSIRVKQDVLKNRLIREINNFIDQTYNNKINLKYQLMKTEQDSDDRSIVKVYTSASKNQFNIKGMIETNNAKGSMTDVKDQETLKAILEIKFPDYIENDLRECYIWKSEMAEASLLNFMPSIDFADIYNLDSYEWCYKNPISITSASEIDIGEYYIEEEAYPTIIIYSGHSPLRITTSLPHKNQFKGLIIGDSFIELEDGIEVEGIVPTLVGNESFTYNPELLCKIIMEDKKIFRKILDYLGLTEYNISQTLTGAMGIGKLKYSTDSILHIGRDDISIIIQSLVKES